MLTLVESDNMPLRLFLGEAPLAIAAADHDVVISGWTAWPSGWTAWPSQSPRNTEPIVPVPNKARTDGSSTVERRA